MAIFIDTKKMLQFAPMKTLLLTLLFLPTTVLAQESNSGVTLRDRAVLRGVQRLGIGTDFGIRTNMIRLGHNVRTRRMSPRRVVAGSEGEVIDIVDGSLLHVRFADGSVETVRTLGAEAPLLDTGTEKQQCFAREAIEQLRKLTLGKTVLLEKDRNFRNDNLGRLLRYVRLNSLDVGGWMIWNGYAFSDNNNSYRRQTDYQARQREAREYERGLWGHYCEYNPDLDTIEVLE